MAIGISEAAGAAGGLLGAGLGMIAGNKAASDQHKRNKELAEISKQNQLEIWNKTNAQAQVAHYKAAGLNPALMYGTSGQGGQLGSGGTGSAGQAQVPTFDIMNGIAQAKMMEAQKQNIEANTEKTRVEAEKIKGVDTDVASATLDMQRIQNEIAGKTKEEATNYIKDQAAEMLARAVTAQNNQTITEETRDDQVRKIKAEAIGALIENEIRGTQVNLNKERIKEIANQIQQRWEDLRLQGESIETSIKNTEKMAEAMLWGAGIHAAGSLTNTIIGVASKGGSIQKMGQMPSK